MGRKYAITSKRICRKSHKKGKHGPSLNKYADMVHKRSVYDAQDKTFRDLPIPGEPGQIFKIGLRLVFHGRLYQLVEDVTVPKFSVIPGTHVAMGKFKFVTQIDT